MPTGGSAAGGRQCLRFPVRSRLRLARGRDNSGPGRCFCVIDVLIFSWARTCVAFVLAGVAITSTPAWGLAPRLRRHLRRRRRTALPGTPWPGNGSCPHRGIPPGHSAGMGELGNTSFQQLDTRRLHAARGRRLNVSFAVAAADRSVAGADLAQRADGGAAPPPDQGAQGAGVLVADRRGDGVDCLAGRTEQEGRLIQPDLVEEVDR
jgi:hypothetical protein